MVDTYRELFKWGNTEIEEDIDQKLAHILVERIGLDLDPLPTKPGEEEITTNIDSSLPAEILSQFESIVGADNVSTDTGDLLIHAYGASYIDMLRLRKKELVSYPQAVLYPREEEDLVEILRVCSEFGINVVPVGGMTSVTEGIKYTDKAISVNLTRHFTAIREINPTNQSVTVEAGILGPELERELNRFRSEEVTRGFTCGHFPQSFEFSTVGGWVVTRGAGQESTGYGKIEEMVLGLRMVSPTGVVDIPEYPAKAMGPDLLQVVIGSEGTLGIVSQLTLKIRHLPEVTRYGSFLFKTWEKGVQAVRTIMQKRSGRPFVFRLSDPEETDIYLEMAEPSGWKQWILEKLGYKPHQRVLMMCSTAGSKAYAGQVMKSIKQVVKRHHGFHIGTKPVKEWLKDRFHTPYMRSALMDQNLIIDTLETSTGWTNIHQVWSTVRSVITSRPNTIAMVHLSHMYENGANLYFTFISNPPEPIQITDYQNYQQRIISAIVDAGGSVSHHHGIGRLLVPWLEKELGNTGYEILRSIKTTLDPDNLMNPGVLGLGR